MIDELDTIVVSIDSPRTVTEYVILSSQKIVALARKEHALRTSETLREIPKLEGV